MQIHIETTDPKIYGFGEVTPLGLSDEFINVGFFIQRHFLLV